MFDTTLKQKLKTKTKQNERKQKSQKNKKQKQRKTKQKNQIQIVWQFCWQTKKSKNFKKLELFPFAVKNILQNLFTIKTIHTFDKQKQTRTSLNL